MLSHTTLGGLEGCVALCHLMRGQEVSSTLSDWRGLKGSQGEQDIFLCIGRRRGMW